MEVTIWEDHRIVVFPDGVVKFHPNWNYSAWRQAESIEAAKAEIERLNTVRIARRAALVDRFEAELRAFEAASGRCFEVATEGILWRGDQRLEINVDGRLPFYVYDGVHGYGVDSVEEGIRAMDARRAYSRR